MQGWGSPRPQGDRHPGLLCPLFPGQEQTGLRDGASPVMQMGNQAQQGLGAVSTRPQGPQNLLHLPPTQ